MFCDLAGATELSRKLDPEDLRSLVKAYQRAAAVEIARFGGHVAQYLGDGIVVYFGYPKAHDDDPSRAVAAALGVLQAVRALSAETKGNLGVPLDVRIGIHTGVVVIGEMGGGGFTERLAVGDTPNIAARIQGKAALNQVLISASTAKLAQRRYVSVAVGDFQLKGIADPVTLYMVTGERDLEAYLQSQVGAQVDRSEELATLLTAWSAATIGAGKAVLLKGEAGIGKSSMLQFLRRRLGPETSYETMTLRFSEHDRDNAYHVFAEQLRRACRFEPTDDNATRVAKLRQTLASRSPALLSHLGVYASLLSLRLPPDLDGGPTPTKPLTNLALERWLHSHAGEAPLLVQVEDLQWADPSSLEVLSSVTGAISGRRALMLLTARREFEPPWKASQSVIELPLGRLSDEHVSQIIANTAGAQRISNSVMQAMLERIDGVPFFAEELTKTVLDSDLPQREGTVTGSTQASVLAIPATLHDSLMARLDRSSDYRGVVQMCAVLGRTFDFETLQALSELDEAVLNNVLDRLIYSEIVFRAASTNRQTFAFRHTLLQHLAYESLLRSDRVRLHRKAGELLEKRLAKAPAGTDTSELVGGLAYHWSRAVSDSRPEAATVTKAVQHRTAAGELQLMRCGYQEAATHFEQAMKHVMTLPEGRERDALELTVRTRISTVLKATVGPAAETVRLELERCHQLCQTLGNRPELGSVLYSFWQLNLFRALYPESLRYAQLCLAEAERTGDPDLLIQSYVALSNTYFWLGDLDKAEQSYKKVLAQYDPAKHGHHALIYGMDPGVLALMFGTWIPQITGRLAEAQARHAELEKLSAELQHPLSMALALNTSCCYHVNRGDFEGTRKAGQAMIELARTHGMFVYEIIGIHFRGWGAARAGEVDQVIDEVRGSYHNYVTRVGGLAQSYIALLAAGVFEAAGEIDEAIATLDRVLEVVEADHCRELAYQAELVRLRGELLAKAGRDDEALAAFQATVDQAVPRNQPPFALRGAIGLLRLAERRGEGLNDARALVRTQLERFGPHETTEELESARALVR